MELIPRGAYIMGKSEEDQAKLLNAPTKTVTVRSFYMDDTEITNSEYRQFVEWVKDSITRTKLAVLADELGIGPKKAASVNMPSGMPIPRNYPPMTSICWKTTSGWAIIFTREGP